MLHRISVGEVRTGMFVSSIDCSWLNSPFWRSRFLVKGEADIARLREAGVATVMIDDARGIGPVPSVPPVTAAMPDPVRAQEAAPPLVVERRAPGRVRRRVLNEIDRARETVERSKVAVERMFAEARLGNAINVGEVVPLVDEIAASIERDRSAILNVTRLKNKNEYTYLHSVAVCALMMNLARQIDLPEAEVQQAGLAGLLHDIGKMATPTAVLEKPGRLDPDERRIIEDHPSAGHRILSESADVGSIALDVCLHHHERVDGRGYPEGLTAGQLSIHARMGAICDVYDAITSHRPYKQPWSPSEALAKMMSWEGHFDTRLLRAFVASIGIFPTGGLVRLHSNRLAIVLPNATEDADLAPMSPLVRVFYSVTEGRYLPLADVRTNNAPGGDPIIRGENGELWFADGWAGVLADVEAGTALTHRAAPAVVLTGAAA